MSIQQPVLQSTVLINGEYGLKYLKLVKSPSGPHYIIDVMFQKGLRLTSNLVDGQMMSDVKADLSRQIEIYRPHEKNVLLPAVDVIVECAMRALTDEKGRIAKQIRDEMTMKEAWESTLFAILLRKVDKNVYVKFEDVEEILKKIYTNNPGSSA